MSEPNMGGGTIFIQAGIQARVSFNIRYKCTRVGSSCGGFVVCYFEKITFNLLSPFEILLFSGTTCFHPEKVMTILSTLPVLFCLEQNGFQTNGFTNEDKNSEENVRSMSIKEIHIFK